MASVCSSLVMNDIPFHPIPSACNSIHHIFSSWHVAWHREDALECRKSHPSTSLHHLFNPKYHVTHPECLPLQSILHPQLEWPFQNANLSMSAPTLNTLWAVSHLALGKSKFSPWPTRHVRSGPQQFLRLVSYHAPHTGSAPATLASYRLSTRRLPWTKNSSLSSWSNKSFFWSQLNSLLREASQVRSPATHQPWAFPLHWPSLQFSLCLTEGCHRRQLAVFLYL